MTEVASGQHGVESDEGEGQKEGLGAVEGGDEAAEDVKGKSGYGELEQGDEEFGGGWDGEVEVRAEDDGQGGEPDNGGSVGVENFGAVELGTGQPALGHKEEPELVVSGGGNKGEQGGHAKSSGDQDAEDFD